MGTYIKTFQEALDEAKPGEKLVYGTRTRSWYIIDKTDRDYTIAVDPEIARKIGEAESLLNYLGSRIIY